MFGVFPPTFREDPLKMLLGWAAFHQEELRENRELAKERQELFAIEPLNNIANILNFLKIYYFYIY